jgi:long-chain acyl-CoA synthetase
VIEDALYEHPAVAEAVVLSVPDSYRGQAPLAFVTLRAGEFRTEDELRDFLRDKISPIELPLRVQIRTSLLKTVSASCPVRNYLKRRSRRVPREVVDV